MTSIARVKFSPVSTVLLYHNIILTPINQRTSLVPVVGVEPTRCLHQGILSPSRLPIPSHRQRTATQHSLVAVLYSLLTEILLQRVRTTLSMATRFISIPSPTSIITSKYLRIFLNPMPQYEATLLMMGCDIKETAGEERETYQTKRLKESFDIITHGLTI